jgi:hypothetical protein
LNGKQAKAAKILQQAQDNDDERMEKDEKLSSAAPIISNTPTIQTPLASSLPPVEPVAADDDDNIT